MSEHPSGKEFHKKFGLPKGIKHHPLKKKMVDKMPKRHKTKHGYWGTMGEELPSHKERDEYHERHPLR